MSSVTPQGPLSVLDPDDSAQGSNSAPGDGAVGDTSSLVSDGSRRSGDRPGRLGLLIMAITLVVLVFLTGFGAWSLRSNRTTGRGDAHQGVLRSARVAGVLASSLVSTAHNELQLIAASPAFISGDPAQMQLYLTRLVPALYGFTSGISWIDKSGLSRVSTSNPGQAPVSLADRAYFQTALSGKDAVSPGLKARVGGAYVLVFAVPTRSLDNTVNGVVTGSVQLSQINGALLKQLFGTPDLDVYDSGGRMLLGPDASRLGTPIPPALAAAAKGHTSGLVFGSGPNGTGVEVTAYAKVASAGWTLVVQEPAAQLDAAVDHQYDRSLALLIGLSLASFIAAGFGASKLDAWHRRVADERARFAAVIDRLPAGVAVVGPDARVEMANRPALDALGALDGHSVPAELGTQVPPSVAARLSPGGEHDGGDISVTVDGVERFFAVRSTPVGRRRGGVGAVTLVEETTARQVEERRRVAAADMRAAISVRETAESIAQAVVERSPEAIGSDWSALVVVGSADPRLVTLASDDDPVWREVVGVDAETSRSVLGRAVADQRIIDVGGGGDGPGSSAVGRTIVLPLQSAGRAVGAVAFGYRDPDVPVEVDELAGFAAQVALALDRARRREIEHDVSLTLQRTLLASAPVRRPDLSVALRYQPAADQMLVGGDFYDVIELDDASHLLLIGDVVGHGLEAATTMGQLKIAIRAFAQETRSPARILSKLDEFVTDQLEAARYSTAALVVVDRADQVLRAAVAGHPPPLIRSGDGRVSALPVVQQPLLGLPPIGGRSELETRIPSGATGLCLYTDGLIERPDLLLDDGIARLSDALSHADGWDVERTAEQLMALVGAGPHRDDVALLYALIHS